MNVKTKKLNFSNIDVSRGIVLIRIIRVMQKWNVRVKRLTFIRLIFIQQLYWPW